MDMFILLIVLKMLTLNEAYNFTCPSQPHWNIRAKSMCKPPRNYTCLFDVTFRVNVYRDRCSRPRILGAGYKYVFQPNLNRATCSVNRYQPFIFDTIGYSDCTFQKSLCNGLGQETYENGNSTFDRTCICNTDRGYTFVRNSKNQCYCNPSTDDCSCYLGINPHNKMIGLKDIKCYDDTKMTKRPYLGDVFNISRTIKITEFDNYKYNLNYPTNEYRIKAAISILTLLLAYFVVWIILLKIMRRWIQNRSTPRKFDIVECTDCSITIEWFIDVQDECLSYELNHRLQGNDEWSVRTISDEDVLPGGNERRIYQLQNLLPEKHYELKLRTVYNQVKSCYSESKTKQTLKQAPRKFDLVECTACSITTEWFIDVPGLCQSYELDHRPQGEDDWFVRTFSFDKVLERGNGRRMYTLQNLLPETYYELKLRSVNNHVKSHYSELKTKQTVELAPRKFDIVECTDCSITVAWYIDDPKESVRFELNYRPQRTDNWTVRIFSTEDVLAEENGRLIYILPNLLSNTYYELKLCYVNNHAKSHYSESKTTKTLKRVLPEAINQISKEDKIRYNKLMQSSQTENRYFVRIMLVGKESAGKTCLLRRLLKESISDVSSTDGVDIDVRRCKINIDDGKWTIEKDIDDDKLDRIKRALIPNEIKKRATGKDKEKNMANVKKIQNTDNFAGGKTQDDMSKVENNVSQVKITKMCLMRKMTLQKQTAM